MVALAVGVVRLPLIPQRGWRLVLGGGHDGREVTDKIAGAGVGIGAYELDCKPVEKLEAGALLSGVIGGKQCARAHTEPLDELRDEGIGGKRVELGGSGAMELQEALDAFARLGGHLRRLGGGGEAEDELDLACLSSGTEGAPWGTPAGDLDDAGELYLAQLDGRPS